MGSKEWGIPGTVEALAIYLADEGQFAKGIGRAGSLGSDGDRKQAVPGVWVGDAVERHPELILRRHEELSHPVDVGLSA
jgi:hypothetical protein